MLTEKSAGSCFEILLLGVEDGIRYAPSNSVPAAVMDLLGDVLQNLQIFVTLILIKSESNNLCSNVDPDVTDGKTCPGSTLTSSFINGKYRIS